MIVYQSKFVFQLIKIVIAIIYSSLYWRLNYKCSNNNNVLPSNNWWATLAFIAKAKNKIIYSKISNFVTTQYYNNNKDFKRTRTAKIRI